MPDASQQTGVVVVALPRGADPVHDIGPEPKHATLLYFGDVPDSGPDSEAAGDNPNDQLDQDFATLLRSVLSIAAATYGPFTEQVTGVEELGDQGAMVWMLQGTGLPDLRADLLDTDSEMVGPLGNVQQYPTYTPHVTIGYPEGADLTYGDSATHLADGDLEDAGAVTEITFDRLALWWAGDQYEYPLIGTADPARGGAVAEQHHPGSGGPAMSVRLVETTPLSEAGTAASSGRWQVQAISAGKGSSGFYSADVLKEAAKKQLIAAGTPLFFDHASESERHDRPERSVRDIAAVFTGPATYDPVAEALVGPVQVFGPYRELVDEMAPHIGLSISGSATDIVDGVIEGLARIDSVDLVTRAGRGGKFKSLMESARAVVEQQAAEAGAPPVGEAAANDTRDALSNLLRDEYGAENTYVWVRDFDPEAGTVWFEINADGGDSGLYGQDFTSNAGVVSLTGDRIEVRVVTNYVPATRPDSTTTQETQEVPMGQIQIDETEHTRLVEAAGRVDTLTSERDTEKARADAAEAKLAEVDTTAAAPRNPREVMERRMEDQGRQIALLRAGQVARGVVAEVLAAGWIGEAQAARLTNELIAEASLPLTEAGELDEATLRARALARLDEAETEAAEILASAGVGSVKGLGATQRASEVALKQYGDDLAESFKELGLSESAIETAVKGR